MTTTTVGHDLVHRSAYAAPQLTFYDTILPGEVPNSACLSLFHGALADEDGGLGMAVAESDALYTAREEQRSHKCYAHVCRL